MRSLGSMLVQSAAVLAGAVLLTGCAAKYSQVPPRVDLAPHGRVALVVFHAADADRDAAVLATQRFAEAVLGSQTVELLELPAGDTAWRRAADSVGAPVAFLGDLALTGERAHGSVSLAGVNVRTTVTAELSVRLMSAESGGTLWRSSSRRRGTVGRVALTGAGLPTMSVRDREEAYGELVEALVGDVTRDLRETWVRQ